MSGPPPPVSGEVGDWATFAVAQRHSKKQEDKFLLKVLSTNGAASWADFCCAVLDGHNGRRAADTCALRLPALVSEELARLCAASGVTHNAHADAASPNWHPQVRTPHWCPARGVTLDALCQNGCCGGAARAFRVRSRLGAVPRGSGAAEGPYGTRIAPPPAAPRKPTGSLASRRHRSSFPPQTPRTRDHGRQLVAHVQLTRLPRSPAFLTRCVRSAAPAFSQLESAISAAFIRLDSEIKSVVPDGTTASFVLLKRAGDGAQRRRCAGLTALERAKHHGPYARHHGPSTTGPFLLGPCPFDSRTRAALARPQAASASRSLGWGTRAPSWRATQTAPRPLFRR